MGLYIPIQGVKYSIVPEISLLGKSLWETQLHAQENNLVVLSSGSVYKVARAVQREPPNRQFIAYARERTDLNDKDVIDAYKQLHDQIWRQTKRIRAKEILVWWYSYLLEHPMIVPRDFTLEIKSFLIRDYKVNHDRDIDMDGAEPNSITPVNWLKKNGVITPEIAKLLEVKRDVFITTKPDTTLDNGLRGLYWEFFGSGNPILISDWGLELFGHPLYEIQEIGSLLGNSIPDK